MFIILGSCGQEALLVIDWDWLIALLVDGPAPGAYGAILLQ